MLNLVHFGEDEEAPPFSVYSVDDADLKLDNISLMYEDYIREVNLEDDIFPQILLGYAMLQDYADVYAYPTGQSFASYDVDIMIESIPMGWLPATITAVEKMKEISPTHMVVKLNVGTGKFKLIEYDVVPYAAGILKIKNELYDACDTACGLCGTSYESREQLARFGGIDGVCRSECSPDALKDFLL
jgi:hypothetical protein